MEHHLLFLYILKSFFKKILTIYLEIVFVVPILKISLSFFRISVTLVVYSIHMAQPCSLVLSLILSLKYSIASGSIGKTMKTPYKRGKPCEDCSHHCDNGLCSS